MLSIAVIVALFGCVFAEPPDPATCGLPAIQPSLGNSRVDGRIVGGKEVVKYSWPWQIQVRYNGGHFCGASLASSTHIISAAHCFRGYSPASFQFQAGRHSKTATDNPNYVQVSAAGSVMIHEQYNPLTINNDVSVIRLATPFTLNDQVSPVCLPTWNTDLPAGTLVHVTGWGATEGTCCSTVLKQVEVPIVSREDCNKPISYNGAVTAGMLCAGDLTNGGIDSCQGDSGGPLVNQLTPGATSQWYLSGIVSWGSGCADRYKPGVYTNVFMYKDWILGKIGTMEREDAKVAQKFRPAPFGAAFREMTRELVEKGEVSKSDLPMNGDWLE